MGFNATFDVQTIKELNASSIIRYGISVVEKSVCVGEVGDIGQTAAWKGNSVTSCSAVAIYFEAVTPAG